MQRAEKWASVAAAVTGEPYPWRQLTEAWKLVLFNQFHDILAGTSIRSAYDDARDEYGRARSIAAESSTAPSKPSPAVSTSRCASTTTAPGRLQPAPLGRSTAT